MKTLNEICQLTDENEIIEAMGNLIQTKKNENEDFFNLSEKEQTFLYIDNFEGSMNEGGFHYFFAAEIGSYVEEIIIAYQKIEAVKTAEIIANAVKIFPKKYSTQTKERQLLLEKATEEVLSAWEDLDELFFTDETEEDTITLMVNYIKKQ